MYLQLKRVNKTKLIFIIVNKKKVNSNKISIIEVLGSYNLTNNYLILNIFRIIYWLSKNTYCTYDVLEFFIQYNIISILK